MTPSVLVKSCNKITLVDRSSGKAYIWTISFDKGTRDSFSNTCKYSFSFLDFTFWNTVQKMLSYQRIPNRIKTREMWNNILNFVTKLLFHHFKIKYGSDWINTGKKWISYIFFFILICRCMLYKKWKTFHPTNIIGHWTHRTYRSYDVFKFKIEIDRVILLNKFLRASDWLATL